MRAEARIAITGAAGALGRAIRDRVAERKVPAEQVALLEHPSDEAIISEYAGQPILIGALEPESLSDQDLVFLCGPAKESAICLGWRRKAGALFVDLSGGAASVLPEAPVVNTRVNPEALEARPGTVIAPHPVSYALSSALAPLERAIGIETVEAVVLRPVSDFGEPGIEELQRQTVSLLNFTGYPIDVFGRQIAFNLLPQSALDARERALALEGRIAGEVTRVLGWAAPKMTLKALVVPIFHGHGLLVHVEPSRAVDAGSVAKILSGASGLSVGSGRGKAVSPVELTEGEEIRIVELASDGLPEGGIWLWILGSDLQGGAARNAVEIAGRVWHD